MVQRVDLRAYQDSIASRLAAAQAEAGVPAFLGFESGGVRWLIDLPAAGEVLPLPALASVPLTRDWFAGLVNVHGELQAVVDFSVFCGGLATPHDGQARILRIGARHGSNAALLVARVHGLKRSDTLSACADADAGDTPPAPGWRGDPLVDAQGERWIRLEPAALFTDPAFLDAALPDAGAVSGYTP